jgi:carbon storage regulator
MMVGYACQIGGMGQARGRSLAKRKVHRMLVLTRKANQSIMIGDDVEVSVLSIMGEKVRIGIQAPRAVPVFRMEIYLEIHHKDGEDATDKNVRTEVDDALHGLGESS